MDTWPWERSRDGLCLPAGEGKWIKCWGRGKREVVPPLDGCSNATIQAILPLSPYGTMQGTRGRAMPTSVLFISHPVYDSCMLTSQADSTLEDPGAGFREGTGYV